MKTREELLSEAWIFYSYKDACNFALEWCNYYDLHNEIEDNTKGEFYVIFSELENEQE